MASVPEPTPPSDDDTPPPSNPEALPAPVPAPQQPAPKRDTGASLGALVSFIAGLVAFGVSMWCFCTDHTSDNAAVETLLVALPLLAGPSSWWISKHDEKHDEEVEKIIRRELFPSVLGIGFAAFAVNRTGGKLHDSIASGALSLVTGALIISSFRALIEACAARLKQRNRPEIEPPDATS